MVNICLAACITATVCHVPPDECKPTLPDWATQRWVYDAAGIVAGESVHGCAECDLWIACTVVGDVMLREYHPLALEAWPLARVEAAWRETLGGG